MSETKQEEVESPEIHFEPIIKLPEVEVKSLEEEEDELLKMRAKLFRFDTTLDPAEWKERGTGDCKLLKHKETGMIRLLMRRDKTLKVCANHYITAQMELKPNCGSDRAWLWNVMADYADEEPKPETLAIRFANAENANKFKDKFNEAKEVNSKLIDKEKLAKLQNGSGDKDEKETEEVTEKLGGMSVKSDSNKDDTEKLSEKSENKTDDEKKESSDVPKDNTDNKDEPAK